MPLFDDPPNGGLLDYLTKGPRDGHGCVQSGCTGHVTGGKIRTDGGWVQACSKHKEVAGGKKPKNVLAEAEKAQARKLAAEARRQEREANKKNKK